MTMEACILARVVPGKASEALEAVKKFPEVKKAYFVFGRYDIVAFVEAPSYEAMTEITAGVNAVDSLKSTETLIEA